MLTVYLDKNVLSHILTVQRTGVETNQVTTADVKKFKQAVAAGRVRNLMSVMQIQEAAYALEAPSGKVAQEELSLIRELLYQERVIKFPKDLLFDDICNYANGTGLSDPLMPNDFDLDGLFTQNGDIEERKQALADTAREAGEFLEATTAANNHDREIILAEFGNVQPKFDEFYKARIIPRLIGVVESAERHSGRDGLAMACEKRRILEMLEFRSMAIAAGASISYQYARVFGELSEKERRKKGDSPDLKHALLCSAADILVTHDGDFSFWFGRVPRRGVEVIDHLHKLLDRVYQS
jgi:hypothetical protein